MNSTKRNPAADIIRCLALFFVVSVHFMLKNGFYAQPNVGIRMYIMTIMRALFIICVPLFITLSGYLLRKKQLCKSYFLRIFKILLTYTIVAFICLLFAKFFMHENLSINDAIGRFLNYRAAPYGWYIEMYIGLFILIPFLNILYNNLANKKQKSLLIIAFIVLTALPSVINITFKIVPSWWTGVYPITYYFIGCFLGEYGINLKKRFSFPLIILTVFVSGSLAFWLSHKEKFKSGQWCEYNSFFSVILVILIFAFFTNINYEKMPVLITKFLKTISGLCLGGYLVSSIFDTLLYPILISKVSYMPNRLEYYFLIVPAVYVLSLILSYFISKIQWCFENLFGYTLKKFKNKEAT